MVALLKDEWRPEIPVSCPQDYKELIQSAWKQVQYQWHVGAALIFSGNFCYFFATRVTLLAQKPVERPTFEVILFELRKMLENATKRNVVTTAITNNNTRPTSVIIIDDMEESDTNSSTIDDEHVDKKEGTERDIVSMS